MLHITYSSKNVQLGGAIKRCNHSVVNSAKIAKRGMDDMEEISGIYGDSTDNPYPDPAIGELERVITQDPLEIS
jgi:hypothetical protein